jgi:hypothetical protein
MHQFHDLLGMVESGDERFFWWNDIYFMTRCQEIRAQKKIKDPRIAELNRMLLYRVPPKTLHDPLFAHRILRDEEDGRTKDKLIASIRKRIAEFERVLKKHGTGLEWILTDIPEKDVVFTRGLGHIVKRRTSDNLYRERDPIKIVAKDGTPSLLVERANSLMPHLSGFINFVPSVYANDSAVTLLRAKGLITD